MVFNREVFSVFGIDPGSRNIGIAVYLIDIYTLEIVKIIPIQISLDKYVYTNLHNANLHIRLLRLMKEMNGLLRAYNPLAIGIESGFINVRRPGAVIPLASAISVISTAVNDYNSEIKLVEYTPSIIKKTIGANPHGNKNPVFEALLKIKEVDDLVDLNYLTEHTIDGIAIAYNLLKEIRTKGIQCLL